MDKTLERVELLLAALLIRSMAEDSQGQKALALSRAGFSNSEIGKLLGTRSQVINQQLYAARKRKAARRKK